MHSIQPGLRAIDRNRTVNPPHFQTKQDQIVDFLTPVIMPDTGKDTGKIGRLLNCAFQGDVEGVKMLLDEGLPVDSPDYDGRTAMHLAASEGYYDVVEYLLKTREANVNPVDRWRKTPLADARRYVNMGVAKTGTKRDYNKVCKILVEHNGSTCSPYEIDLDVQHLESCTLLSEVAARVIHRNPEQSTSPTLTDSQMINQISLLQRLRHPNIVQFLGAVTNFQNKTKPLVLVTEHLPNGDLRQLLQSKKGRKFQAKDAVNYALDIARGMNYLHRHKPDPIVHSELHPMNLQRDAAGRLKVAGLGLSKLIGCINMAGPKVRSQTQKDMKESVGMYGAPELKKDKSLTPTKSVDVYSFGIILYEMLEGLRPSLASRQAHERVPGKDIVCPYRTTLAPKKLGKLIMECLAMDPNERPKFQTIIIELERAREKLTTKPWWAPRPMIRMGRNLVTTVTQQWYSCVKNTRRALSHSIASVEDSMRGNLGRCRRGEITNFHPIEEEARDEDKEKALTPQL